MKRSTMSERSMIEKFFAVIGGYDEYAFVQNASHPQVLQELTDQGIRVCDCTIVLSIDIPQMSVGNFVLAIGAIVLHDI